MFPPPTDSMFYGGYAEARAKCKAERRWLLVNIQRPTEFASNRDTWSSDLISHVKLTAAAMAADRHGA